jgi:hypothetical protein
MNFKGFHLTLLPTHHSASIRISAKHWNSFYLEHNATVQEYNLRIPTSSGLTQAPWYTLFS